jgi:hypothetical protein
VDFFPFLEEFASKAQMNIQFLEDYNVPKKHNHPYRDISMNLHLDTLDLSDSVSFLSASLSRKSRDRTSDPCSGISLSASDLQLHHNIPPKYRPYYESVAQPTTPQTEHIRLTAVYYLSNRQHDIF